MAIVQRVLDTETGRYVALKRLRASGTGSNRERIVRLFEREYLTLAQLAHPRVVEVYDYGHDSEGPYYTMELLDGGDLHGLAPVAWQKACLLARDVCSALALLHSRRMVYRDLSPRNVRCTSDGLAKLIDFGAMTSMGQSRELVGTPPFVAPEALNLQPLDARTDLYALGATLYFTLVQRHAYPARDLSQLRDLWRSRPRRPSEIVSGIPEALDGLVMDLMHLDPAMRPASAAEVMARLAAIAGLRSSEQLLVTQAYLSNPTLVGRTEQLTPVRKVCWRAAQRRGASLLVRGPSGIGRSRFLDACVLEAKLAGLQVLRASPGESASQRFGIVETLAAQLLKSLRTIAVEAAEPDVALLGHAVPELIEGRSDLKLEPIAEEHELQRRVHAAMQAWLGRAARKRSLMVAVDDFEQLGEHSAALLALLAQEVSEHGLLLATAVSANSMESVALRGARELLENASLPIDLAPLTLDQTEELLGSVFGDVPNVAVLATYLHRVSGGSPRDTMQLAQQLVNDGVIRYFGGSWSLPSRLSEAVLPSSMAEALAGRVARLGVVARRLALALACEPGQRFTFEECGLLMRGVAPRELAQAVDELIAAEVCVLGSALYSLRQETWVAAIRESASPQQLHAAHGALALVFESRGDEVRQAGHLLKAGAHARGVDVLVRHAAESKLRTNADAHAFFSLIYSLPRDWLQTYEHVLRLITELKRPARERSIVLSRVDGIIAHAVSDTFGYAHIQAHLDRLAFDAGLDIYASLPETAEPGVRLKMALGAAQARHEGMAENERTLPPGDAVKALAQTVLTALGAISYAQDYDAFRALPSLAPFAPLSPSIGMIEQLRHGVGARLSARNELATQIYHRLLARMSEPDRAGLDRAHYVATDLRLRLSVATMDAAMGRSACLEQIAIVEQQREYAAQGMLVRHIYHVWQGNMAEASRCKRQAEVLLIENTAHHGFDGQHLFSELCAYTLADDLTRVKRVNEAIEPRAPIYKAWRPALHFGRGEYQRIRGDAQSALQELETALSLMEPGYHALWPNIAGAHLRVLNELERYDDVVRLANDCLIVACELGYQQNFIRMPLSIALAKLGRSEEAIEVADLVVSQLEELGSTGLLLATAYEVRARVSLAAGDQERFEHFAALATAQWPGAEKRMLGVKYQRSGDDRDEGEQVLDQLSILSQFNSTLENCQGTEARAALGLEYLARQSSATAGILYVLTRGGLVRSATFGEMDVDDELDGWALSYFDRETEEEEGTEAYSNPPPATGMTQTRALGPSGFVPVLLNHQAARGFALTGLALLLPGDGATFIYPSRLAAELSRTLADANDVTTLYT
jgi:tetratricopeptide (TPR) repeat protein/tRNA A-37 threonylcarbamoyl transferase component Bud32